MRKPAFAYFYGLCILLSFSLLTITVRGGGGMGYQISIAYCLFSFCHFCRKEPLLKLRTSCYEAVDDF